VEPVNQNSSGETAATSISSPLETEENSKKLVEEKTLSNFSEEASLQGK
jgi:hypothetical protein